MEWITQYSHNVALVKPVNGLVKFNVPNKDGIHILVKSVNGIIATSETLLSATFRITGTSPVFVSADGGVPKARFCFQRKGDNWSGTGDYAYYRWWSNPVSFDLGVGDFTIETKMKPTKWSSVLGKFGNEVSDKYWEAVNNAAFFGVAFGGNYFSHGAWLKSGTASFKILTWKLT